MIPSPDVEELFLTALEKPAGERDSFLKLACGGDAAKLARLRQLLAAHELSRGPLDSPAAGTGAWVASADGPGNTIGPYKLLQEIGEGGMGTVYMAQQLEPVKRLVALKITRPGVDSRRVVARFEAERQALALMDHPNIAKVLDAGATAVGRPYFVMELVKGVPITTFCDDRRLTVPERLELFRQVCAAVQHAHQKGIIHRDLKPSNILVELHDGRPVPKVIDFGLAKALHDLSLTDKTLFTNFGVILGTPLYMAPEQAEFEAVDVDTRADVYALGVLLYELLTGSTPFEKKQFAQVAWDDIRRLIKEVEPPRPSIRLSTDAALPSVAARRQVEPARLGKFVRGDLDWIVMKALAKERERRYETATALADDVGRFLRDEPVTAGPPGARYRFGKFIRRNRGRVAAAAILLVVLVAGLAGTSLGLIEARRQRDAALQEQARADRERDEARRQEAIAARSLDALYSIATTHDPIEQFFPGQLGGRTTSEMTSASLATAQSILAGVLADRPRERARLEMVLGNVQRSRGEWEDARILLNRAATTFRALPDAAPEELAMALYYLGWYQRDVGDLRAAEQSFRQCLALLAGRGAATGLTEADVHFQIGWVLADLAAVGPPEKRAEIKARAVAAMKKAEESYARSATPGADVKAAVCQIAVIATNTREQQINFFQLAAAIAKLPARTDLPSTIQSVIAGEKARQRRELPEAIRQFAFAEAGVRRIFGAGHPFRALVLALLAESHSEAGDKMTAERLIREALALGRKSWPHHPRMIEGLRELARLVLESGGDRAEALKLVDEADAIAKRHGEDQAYQRPGLAELRERIEAAMPKPPAK